MNTVETFWWGCVGGVCGYLAAFVLPWLKDLWDYPDQDLKVTVTVTRIILVACIGLVYVLIGGIAALLIAYGAEPKQAIAAGIASETLLKAGTSLPKRRNGKGPKEGSSSPSPPKSEATT
jgi:hypothetical protein